MHSPIQDVGDGARYKATAFVFRDFNGKLYNNTPVQLLLVSLFWDQKTMFREEKPMTITLSLLSDRARSELQVVAFDVSEYRLEVVMAAVMKKFLNELQRGLHLKVGDFTFACVGTLHDYRCDMEGFWMLL